MVAPVRSRFFASEYICVRIWYGSSLRIQVIFSVKGQLARPCVRGLKRLNKLIAVRGRLKNVTYARATKVSKLVNVAPDFVVQTAYYVHPRPTKQQTDACTSIGVLAGVV